MASSIHGSIFSPLVSSGRVVHDVRNHCGNSPIPLLQTPTKVPLGGSCYSDGMEVVWHGEFSRMFGSFCPPHIWYLTITNQVPQGKWKYHRDSAKVRFCCQDCGNGWTSMKGRVTFWFHLDYQTNAGFMQFKLYGQQCKKCNSGKFEYVMWYPEEVSKVMCNVYHKVGQTYYGFCQPPIRVDRRPGRPRNQHNTELCQACRDGECDQVKSKSTTINLNGVVHQFLSRRLSEEVSNVKPASSSPSSNPVEKTITSTTETQSNLLVRDSVNPQNTSPPTNSGNSHSPPSKHPESSKTEQTKEPAVVISQSTATKPFTHGQTNFTGPIPIGNGPCIYHPAPVQPLFAGMIPFLGQTVYPYFPPHPSFGAMMRPLPPVNICTITDLMANSSLNEKTEIVKKEPKLSSRKDINNNDNTCTELEKHIS